MQHIKLVSCLLLLLLTACKMADMQEIGYAAAQNYGQSQCQQRMANDCDKLKSYDAYQRERQQVTTDTAPLPAN